ncbi:MCE family protein [Mycobacterium sp. E2479]|uniref:MCE family protein n=1 Tax=Mycobacterium sp. E2479 TaxID=1834134 RepID=UPI00080133BD|nr:MCE family protein [Mycobacterium sp. E2479]OBH49260.1 MCE-family protein [Mycobacterium sp. E2479]
MALDARPRRLQRIAALLLAGLLGGCTVLTYLFYSAAFTSTDKVTIDSARAGLVMDPGAKVKYLGVQVGQVESISYEGDHARLELAIHSDQMQYIPSNAIVRIASNTVFGAKSVEFKLPAHPSSMPLRPNTHLQASSVSVEVNTLFESLLQTLHKIDPVELNGTLSAISDGLRNNGKNMGATISELTDYLGKINPKMATLQDDFQKTAATADIYGDAAPDLVTIFDNTPTIAHTIEGQRDNLTATLLAVTGLADNGYQTLAPAENDYIDAIQRLRAPLKVLGDYSPQNGCLLQAMASAYKKFKPYVGGIAPGLFLTASFIPGVPAYTYPESLPIVNASGGPNCRGLPDLPTKQGAGSWYRPPFLVTDNAYVPFQPNTELQFDPPSTLQFLFNGAYAERDEY